MWSLHRVHRSLFLSLRNIWLWGRCWCRANEREPREGQDWQGHGARKAIVIEPGYQVLCLEDCPWPFGSEEQQDRALLASVPFIK